MYFTYTPNLTDLYVRIIDQANNQVYSTVAADYVAWDNGDVANYDVALTEIGTSGIYYFAIPAADSEARRLLVAAYKNAAPAITDVPIGSDEVEFNGTSEMFVIDVNGRTNIGRFLGTAAVLTGGVPNVNVKTENNIDFGATKKASITAAVPAVSAIADAVWTEDLTDHDLEPNSGAENLKEILADTNEVQALVTTSGNGDLKFLKDVLEGDYSIDKSGTPYQLVVKIKGTDTELIRKDIADVDGNDLTSTATVIGRLTEPA